MTTEPDLLHPAARQDPYPTYAALRDRAPVQWCARLGMWVVTRYADVDLVVADTRRFSVDRFGDRADRAGAAAVAAILRAWAVYRDPPDHTRLRSLLGQSFTPRRLHGMRPVVQRIVDELVDDGLRHGELEFVSAFAFPLPATVIATMLGAPVRDIGRIKVWSNRIADFIGGARSGADAEHATGGLLEACDYFRTLVRARRASPADDVISQLLAAQDRGQSLTEAEVVANCVLLLFAGHETTTNLLANGLFHLLRDSRQEEALRARPDLVPSAVEEFLRFDAPVAGTLRIAREPVTLGDRKIAAGAVVAAMLASANRDPRRFDRADELDLRRSPNRHLSLGYGTHFCLGAGLARLEAQVAFETLLRRWRRVTVLDQTPRWKAQVFFRELERLPLRVES